MKRFITTLVVIIFTTMASNAKIYVVSVGIADYMQIHDLRFTENDVDIFNDLMRYQGADLTTLKGRQATHINVTNALRLVCGKCKPEDTMVFFFSGHGYEGGFCCYDMRSNNASSNNMLNKQQINSLNNYVGGISYKEIQILFQNCRASKKMVFADACFSGGLKKGNKLNLSVQSARNGDVMYLLSSLQTETSEEMPQGPNGWFTYYLAAGLSGNADMNNDGRLTASEIFNFTASNVAQVTENRQHPEIWGRFNKNLIIFETK